MTRAELDREVNQILKDNMTIRLREFNVLTELLWTIIYDFNTKQDFQEDLLMVTGTVNFMKKVGMISEAEASNICINLLNEIVQGMQKRNKEGA